MKVSEAPSAMLLAVMKDGKPGTGPAQRCPICKRPMVEFVASPGLRAIVATIPDRIVTCVNTRWTMSLPCPGALRAKPVLNGLVDAVSM